MGRDYKKQAEWRKRHTRYFALCLNCNTDRDVIRFIDDMVKVGWTRQEVFKCALRLMMEREGY